MYSVTSDRLALLGAGEAWGASRSGSLGWWKVWIPSVRARPLVMPTLAWWSTIWIGWCGEPTAVRVPAARLATGVATSRSPSSQPARIFVRVMVRLLSVIGRRREEQGSCHGGPAGESRFRTAGWRAGLCPPPWSRGGARERHEPGP